MAEQVIVEVLDGRGGVRGRTKLDRFPATIGRAFSNDVILDDPYASPVHLRLTRDVEGALVAEDCESENGTFEAGRQVRIAGIPVRPGLQLRVGRTPLRFRDPGEPVEATILERGADIWNRLESTPVALTICAVALAALTLNGWLNSYERTTVAKQVNTSLAALAALGLWAGIWALASRASRHRFNFLAHLALASTIVTGFLLVSQVTEWTYVFVPESGLSELLGFVFLPVLAVGLLAGHLAFASAMPRRAQLRMAVVVIGVVFGFVALSSYADRDDFSTTLEYQSTIKPVRADWVRAVTVDEFFKEAATLRADVDTLAVEANRRGATR
jgi:hypothetical protein